MKLDLNFIEKDRKQVEAIDISSLKARVASMLGQKSAEIFTQPSYGHRFMTWLTDNPVGEFSGENIIHGHPEGVYCSVNHYCHHVDYRPKLTDHPEFRKQFYLKWREYEQ